MASKVLKELEELRQMLAQPTPSLLSPAATANVPSFSHLSAPVLLPSVAPCGFTTPLSAASAAGTYPSAELLFAASTGGSPSKLGAAAAPTLNSSSWMPEVSH
jgi:hypothetical protein